MDRSRAEGGVSPRLQSCDFLGSFFYPEKNERYNPEAGLSRKRTGERPALGINRSRQAGDLAPQGPRSKAELDDFCCAQQLRRIGMIADG